MMGADNDPGLIPRICRELFTSIANAPANVSYHVEVSYLEIYNERVRDLLNPQSSGGLRVREHPVLGPYVEDLTKAAVSSYSDVFSHMSQGNKARTVAATNMNEASSRSHAVFTLVVTQTTASDDDDIIERTSRISLVDLAGSERAYSTQATGRRLQEGAKINQSLAALGKVISALADQSKNRRQSKTFVPYRDSVLTWLLKDSLGGNSRTFMIATISPADFGETLSTLRYADRAKHIVNQATVNEDATARLVRGLREEVASLRKRLKLDGNHRGSDTDLADQLRASEKLVADLNQSWEEKLRKTQNLQTQREQALAALGISVDTNQAGMGVGLHTSRDIPHLVNLSEDPLMSECLVYNLKPNDTVVGSSEAVDIRLGAAGQEGKGGGVASRHCYFNYNIETGAVFMHPIGDNLAMVNGQRINEPKELRSGYRVIIGTSFVFRLNHPQQARRERMEQTQPLNEIEEEEGMWDEEEMSASADWYYAWNEAHPDDSMSNTIAAVPNYSPSLWSDDTQSEISETTNTASQPLLPRSYNGRQSAFSSLRRSRRGTIGSSSTISSPQPSLQIQHWKRSRQQRPRTNSTNGDESNSCIRPRGNTVSGASQPPIYTDSQRRGLARMLVGSWRRFRLIKVGQTMLQNAVHLKEANVISKELGQKVVYQFVILRGNCEAFPSSPMEPDALPALLSDWNSMSLSNKQSATDAVRVKALDCPSASSEMPEVAIKVLDIAHTCWYVWSLSVFLERLDKMRRLSTIKGSYRAHLVLDPFHANPSPQYSCIGTVVYPIWPSVDRSYSAPIVDAPVIDSLSGLERGQMTGGIAVLPIRSKQTGMISKWNVIIHVNALHGVSETEMTGVHCHLRLARIRGPLVDSLYVNGWQPSSSSPVTEDDMIKPDNGTTEECSSPVMNISSSSSKTERHSSPLSGFGDGPVNINFRQQWTVDRLTEDTCLVVDFFGTAQPLALRRAFHEDVQLEQSLRRTINRDHSLSASQNLQMERLHEEELFVDSQHELAMWIRVMEPGLDGQWERTSCMFIADNCVSPFFLLRQGLQRRIEVVASHNNSQHMRITGIRSLQVGAPRLVDEKGRFQSNMTTANESRMVELPLINVELAEETRLDNRSLVMARAAWDTSVHGSWLLDVPTDADMRVKLAVTLQLDIENSNGDPIELQTSVFAQIHSRQSNTGQPGGNWLMSWGTDMMNGIARLSAGPKKSRSCVSLSNSMQRLVPDTERDPVYRVFSVTLSPINPIAGKDNLWRLNTGKKYVRGEETLLPWLPRSVQFVDEYHRLEHEEAWRLSVARNRERLETVVNDLGLDQMDQIRERVFSGTTANQREQRLGQLVLEAIYKIRRFRRIPDSGLGLQQEPIESLVVSDNRRVSLLDIKQLIKRQPRNVRPILVQGHFVHRGWVDMLDTNAGAFEGWVRRWLVVERPYVFVFLDKECRYLDNVINVSSARINVDPHVSEMLGGSEVLALYTNTNSYLLRPSQEDIQRWIGAIDEWYFML